MADLTGQDDTPALWPAANGRVSADMFADRPWLGTPVDVGIVADAGARGFVPVALLPASALAGGDDRTFREDWYGRFHLLPSRYLDAGNVVGASTSRFSLWNAWFVDQELTGLTETGAEGLSLDGIAAPARFRALEEKFFTLAITPAGGPVIDARFVFGFATAETLALAVTGRRIIVFALRPDWSSGMLEALEWASEALIAWDGTEQRVRLRAHPRRTFEFAILADGVRAQALEALIHGWGGRNFCVPVWTDQSRLASPISAGTDILSLPEDISTHDYHAGGLAVLWAGDTQAEAAEILSVAGNVVTLKRPLGRSWPAGTRVYPGAVMRLDGAAKLDRVTDRVMSASVRFVDAAYTSLTAAEPDDRTYRGAPLFLWRPDWAQAHGDEIGRVANVLDYTTGLVAVDDITGRAHPVRRMGFLLENRARIHAAKSWLAARAGRMHPCWMPTWSDDLAITRDIQPSDASLYIAAAGLSRFWPDPLRHDLLIRTTQGDFLRRVTGIEAVSDTEESVALDAPLGVAIPRAGIVSAHWLHWSRLDADRVELHWETDASAMLNLATAVLPS
jgi:hypothetical protein